jgi:hypothetical protein
LHISARRTHAVIFADHPVSPPFSSFAQAFYCPAGLRYPTCITPFEELVIAFGGIGGFIGAVLATLSAVASVLVYLCRRRLIAADEFKTSEGVLTNKGRAYGAYEALPLSESGGGGFARYGAATQSPTTSSHSDSAAGLFSLSLVLLSRGAPDGRFPSSASGLAALLKASEVL